MKVNARWAAALLVIAAAGWGGSSSMAEDAEQREARIARSKDPTWKPAATETGLIKVRDGKVQGTLRNFALNAEGNILACFASTSGEPSGIRVYSPEGKLLNVMPLEIQPSAVCVAKDGAIFAAGNGKILKLSPEGKVLASAASPVANEAVKITKETEEMVKESAAQLRRPFKDELATMKANLEKRRSEVMGLSATSEDIFMATPSPSDYTFRVYRFTHALAEPTLVVDKLRGCCGQMDVQARDGKMWIPHNARHAIESFDREGKQLAKFGKAGKVKPSDFGGCCEPKSMRVLANGDILAAESGPPTCIKRFSPKGEFKEVVAVVDDAKGDCVRVTVDMSPDGKKYYMLDTTRDAIRVFAAKK